MADKYPWEDWDEKQRASVDKAMALADAIKLHRSAGALGIGDKAASDALAARGGLSPEEATNLARYKQYKDTTGGDPNWQGPLNINAGAREAPDTPEKIAQRRDAYFAADPSGRARIIDEQKLAIDRGKENFYDSLVDGQKQKPTMSQALNDSMKRKRKG